MGESDGDGGVDADDALAERMPFCVRGLEHMREVPWDAGGVVHAAKHVVAEAEFEGAGDSIQGDLEIEGGVETLGRHFGIVRAVFLEQQLVIEDLDCEGFAGGCDAEMGRDVGGVIGDGGLEDGEIGPARCIELLDESDFAEGRGDAHGNPVGVHDCPPGVVQERMG